MPNLLVCSLSPYKTLEFFDLIWLVYKVGKHLINQKNKHRESTKVYKNSFKRYKKNYGVFMNELFKTLHRLVCFDTYFTQNVK
jgi:phosphatidylserine decarboxylase